MIQQLKAIVGFQEEHLENDVKKSEEKASELTEEEKEHEVADEGPVSLSREDDKEALKIRVDSLEFSSRLSNALEKANIRTLGGLARKNEEDLLKIEGLGEKGITEIKEKLAEYGITLK